MFNVLKFFTIKHFNISLCCCAAVILSACSGGSKLPVDEAVESRPIVDNGPGDPPPTLYEQIGAVHDELWHDVAGIDYPNSIPSSGTATYSGISSLDIFPLNLELKGRSSLNVDFNSGAISGTAYDFVSPDSVQLGGSLALNGARISGMDVINQKVSGILHSEINQWGTIVVEGDIITGQLLGDDVRFVNFVGNPVITVFSGTEAETVYGISDSMVAIRGVRD